MNILFPNNVPPRNLASAGDSCLNQLSLQWLQKSLSWLLSPSCSTPAFTLSPGEFFRHRSNPIVPLLQTYHGSPLLRDGSPNSGPVWSDPLCPPCTFQSTAHAYLHASARLFPQQSTMSRTHSSGSPSLAGKKLSVLCSHFHTALCSEQGTRFCSPSILCC